MSHSVTKKLEMLLTRINYFCFCSKINLESCLPEISNILLQKLQFISLKIKLSSSPTNNEQLFILCCWETAASDHVEDCDHSKYHEDDQSGLSQLDQEVNIILVTWKQKLVLTYWQHFGTLALVQVESRISRGVVVAVVEIVVAAVVQEYL